jgi:diguanylate cyclase (GGDEF)-like protein
VVYFRASMSAGSKGDQGGGGDDAPAPRRRLSDHHELELPQYSSDGRDLREKATMELPAVTDAQLRQPNPRGRAVEAPGSTRDRAFEAAWGVEVGPRESAPELLVHGRSDDVSTAMRDWSSNSNPPSSPANRMCGVLVRLDAHMTGQTIPLGDAPVQIGRGRDADIRIDDEGVSRIHATIRATPHGHEIVDMDSRNGTVVGGRLVRSVVLRDDDVIQLGPRVSLRFQVMEERQAEAMRQLFETSVRDSLTGAYNRAHLTARLRAELAYATRHKSDFGVLLLDVDHFKKVNDTYGHPAGDEVLRSVATTIATRLRAEDVFARYGGEEFIAVLRGVDLGGAALAGERLRRVLAANVPVFQGRPIPVTMSVGVASLVSTPEPTIEAMIAEADRRLYVAKNLGRDRVVATDDGSALPEQLQRVG